MDSILAHCFREHKHKEAWWHKIKTNPVVPSDPSQVGVVAPDEAPEENALSKLLGITMLQLREVFVNCNWAKKRGRSHTILREDIQEFIEANKLTGFIVLGESNKVLVMRLGISGSNQSAVKQWKNENCHILFALLSETNSATTWQHVWTKKKSQTRTTTQAI
jgi:hypothetical protein